MFLQLINTHNAADSRVLHDEVSLMHPQHQRQKTVELNVHASCQIQMRGLKRANLLNNRISLMFAAVCSVSEGMQKSFDRV